MIRVPYNTEKILSDFPINLSCNYFTRDPRHRHHILQPPLQQEVTFCFSCHFYRHDRYSFTFLKTKEKTGRFSNILEIQTHHHCYWDVYGEGRQIVPKYPSFALRFRRSRAFTVPMPMLCNSLFSITGANKAFSRLKSESLLSWPNHQS